MNRADFKKRTYVVFVSLVAAWCGGMILAPALVERFPGLANALYAFYAPVCHQIDVRSFHLFGGKLAVCIRCSSIYFTFFLSLLAFPLFRSVTNPAYPANSWIALAMVPMAVDVFLDLTGLHTSSALTREITGALFGAILPLYLVPPLLEGVSQLRDQFHARGGFLYARKTQ